MPANIASSSTEAFVDAPMVLGGDVRTSKGTLLSGQDLTAGAVLGRVTASGKLVLADQDATNGSELPVGILVHDVDASSGDANCLFYVSGEFNSAKLTWDAGFTATLKLSAFDRTPITIKTPV